MKTFLLQLRNRFEALTLEGNGNDAEDDMQKDTENFIDKRNKTKKQ